MDEATLDIPVFRHKPTDFHRAIKNDTPESKLDTLLREKWKRAEESGVLRYKLNIREWKVLEGSYKFLAQLNLDRASNRRLPEDINSMSQPFNADRFNFTKLPAREMFFDIGDSSGNDVVAANVSPVEWGHTLFLPDRLRCLPQRMTESSLLKALEMMLLSSSIYFRVIFNSLCAHASVNHLHWHFYYLKHQMLLEDLELQQLKGPLFLLRDYPAKGFCLKLSWFADRDIRELGTWAFVVVNYLQENNVAHNVYITRSRTDRREEIYDDIRIYVWARKPSSGVKDTRAFVPAVAEFFGHLSIRSEEEYRTLSEDKVARVLEDVTAEVCTSVQEGLKQAIESRINPEYIRLSKPDYEGWLGEDTEETEDSTTAKHYDTNDYISGPIRVKDGTVPINILEFYHSYAYDCRRYFNLCVADPSTVIFASGNLIHFLNTENGSVRFRRTSTGGGIGHITKNPSANHVAVGENGVDPPIIIYEWPSMEIVTVLCQGTTRSYSHLAYSPDGLLLLSQGGDPDYMITVWNWEKSRILLRCKSHGQDIYNAAFSPTVPGHLTTSGAGHIKFWKMARTFTGLKLKGELGRFGKTEISDIIGVYSMPDEKVVSGCEWGNVLLWDEDLIKLEVCRKGRKPCHSKLITQFEYNNGELLSVGMDGWIRVWYYETIDQADPPEEDRFLQIDPIYEFQIKEADSEDWEESSMLMCIRKQYPDDPERTLWYAQDGNGGLWSVDLGTFENPKQPRKLLTCHAGPITCMDVATWDSFVATCGQDGHLHIYNYLTKRLIMVHRFNDKGSRVVWLPCSVESTGSTLVCAFESGVVRMITVAVLRADRSEDIRGDYVRLIQVSKPHTSAITAMSINSSRKLLITGSEDSTLFVFAVRTTDTYPSLEPIGYVRLFSGVSCVTWKPDHPNTILVGCSRGDCAEVELPDEPQRYTTVSYELVQCAPKFFKFQSVKSKIRRELARLEIERKKEAERESKREKMEKLRADNPGIEIVEEAFLMEDEEDPPLPEIHVPEVPNPVLMANYTAGGTLWLSMAGFDAGYMYEYPVPEAGKNESAEPIRSTVVFDADDTEIRSCLFYDDERYLFLGMERGEIRVCRVNPDDHTDLSDYWTLPMHDNHNGSIPAMSLSHDRKMLLSCGHDGNLFSYIINDDGPHPAAQTENAKRPRELPAADVEDIEEPDHPSLEEVIVKSENDRIMAVAKRKKDATLGLVRSLAEEYSRLMERNRGLVESQRIPQEEFELDPRITADLNDQLKAEMDLVHQKLAFKLEKSRLGLQKLMDHFIEPITCLPFAVSRILKPDTVVHSLRERKLGDDFAANYADVVRRIEEKDKAGRIIEEKIVEEAGEEEEPSTVQGLETFLKGLSPVSAEYRLGVQINQMLRKYRARKERMDQRAKEWKIIHASKPDPNVNHPDDAAAIEQAKNTIGDYKLKISPNFSQSQEKRETTLTKYKQLLDCRKKTHHLREDFNARLRSVRDKKLALQNEVLELIEKLKTIHAEIPEKKIKPLPEVPIIDYDVEYPERNLELEKYTSMAERVKETKRKKMSATEEIIINPMDEEYEVLLLDEKLVESELEMSINTLEATIADGVHKAVVLVSPEVLEALKANDRVETAWEREMKRSRATRKIYEQDSIMEHIRNSYEEVDKQLDELERERLEISADSVYADLFLLTLHQELIVLRDFEAMENLLTDKVSEKLAERDVASKKIEAMNTKIDQKSRDIAKTHDKIKDLTAQFTVMISDNKFADFLRRIFKKKFKPPKEEDDDSSSSDSSSSESSSEDDGASLRSDELGPIHMDEGTCPTGCEKEVYNSAFTMREERYECEHRIKEEQRAIELLHKEVDADGRKLKVVESELKVHRKDLEDFMCEKQNKLNDIDVTVVLKYHQLQHFLDDNSVAKIRDCVVFDKAKLTRLYARVGELQQETLEQKEKHKKNRTHLHRMKVDCKHMDGEIKRLKEKIKQEMMQKFGREVSLSSLYEAVLRKMIYDMKADLKEMTKSFDKQIKCVKDKYNEQVEVLENLIQENTEKLSFMTVLEGEHAKLKKILRHTPESEENILRIEREYREDLARLESILRSQRHQKELFRNDIRNLSLKTRSLPPICTDVKRLQAIRKTSEENIDPTIFDALSMNPEEPPTTDSTQFGSEDGERIEDAKESEGDENTVGEEAGNEENSRTATMVHRLLSRVMESAFEDKEAEGSTREILMQVIESLPAGGSVAEMRAGIERSVDRIIEALPHEDEETVEAMRQAVKESLTDIVTRLEDESRTVETTATEIGWNVRQKVGDLLDSMGIKREIKIQDTLIKILKTDDGIGSAIEYLSRNVGATPDLETLAALREHAFRTLTEIREEMATEEETASARDVRQTSDGEQIDESAAT